MQLNTILKGKTRSAQQKLNQLEFNLSDSSSILWYPSAAYDFRDVMKKQLKSSEPYLYFHTDNNASTDYCQFEKGIVYRDHSTTIEISDVQELEFINTVDDNARNEDKTLQKHAKSEVKVFLLKVNTDVNYDSKTSTVIYFCMDDVDFMEQVLFNYKIDISYVVKVKDISNYGSKFNTLRLFSAFLSRLKINYIHLDHDGQQEFKSFDYTFKLNNFKLKLFRLGNIGEEINITNWKRFIIKMKNKNDDGALTYGSLEKALEITKTL